MRLPNSIPSVAFKKRSRAGKGRESRFWMIGFGSGLSSILFPFLYQTPGMAPSDFPDTTSQIVKSASPVITMSNGESFKDCSGNAEAWEPPPKITIFGSNDLVSAANRFISSNNPLANVIPTKSGLNSCNACLNAPWLNSGRLQSTIFTLFPACFNEPARTASDNTGW